MLAEVQNKQMLIKSSIDPKGIRIMIATQLNHSLDGVSDLYIETISHFPTLHYSTIYHWFTSMAGRKTRCTAIFIKNIWEIGKEKCGIFFYYFSFFCLSIQIKRNARKMFGKQTVCFWFVEPSRAALIL